MKNVYVASGLGNYRLVQTIQGRLRARGFFVPHDWAALYDSQLSLGVIPPEDLNSTQIEAASGVDCLLLVTPAGRGGHIEYGAALGAGVPTVVLLATGVEAIGFYRLSAMVSSVDAAVERLVEMTR